MIIKIFIYLGIALAVALLAVIFINKLARNFFKLFNFKIFDPKNNNSKNKEEELKSEVLYDKDGIIVTKGEAKQETTTNN